jgi:hypothetical protein
VTLPVTLPVWAQAGAQESDKIRTSAVFIEASVADAEYSATAARAPPRQPRRASCWFLWREGLGAMSPASRGRGDFTAVGNNPECPADRFADCFACRRGPGSVRIPTLLVGHDRLDCPAPVGSLQYYRPGDSVITRPGRSAGCARCDRPMFRHGDVASVKLQELA